jgi:hypothetical protein
VVPGLRDGERALPAGFLPEMLRLGRFKTSPRCRHLPGMVPDAEEAV